VIRGIETQLAEKISFQDRLRNAGFDPLFRNKTAILQVNVGKVCNQTCKHCHVEAGPGRTESMSMETMQYCLDAVRRTGIRTVDITGGAPEMNPHFRWFVRELKKKNVYVMVRCNLTIIRAGKAYRDLPEFYAENFVEVISSLPFYNESRTDRQRGNGVFSKSIEALRLLNHAGYGKPESGLILNLVHNPAGAFLPGVQESIEFQFRRSLESEWGIVFNSLYSITNMPVGRFLEYLQAQGKFDEYMETLANAFNPATIALLMCRDTISVGYDGSLYDCDFNQMLGMKAGGRNLHIRDFDQDSLKALPVLTDSHCFGCTAGSGSGCGGELV